jgi:hypothetical protein
MGLLNYSAIVKLRRGRELHEDAVISSSFHKAKELEHIIKTIITTTNRLMQRVNMGYF